MIKEAMRKSAVWGLATIITVGSVILFTGVYNGVKQAIKNNDESNK